MGPSLFFEHLGKCRSGGQTEDSFRLWLWSAFPQNGSSSSALSTRKLLAIDRCLLALQRVPQDRKRRYLLGFAADMLAAVFQSPFHVIFVGIGVIATAIKLSISRNSKPVIPFGYLTGKLWNWIAHIQAVNR